MVFWIYVKIVLYIKNFIYLVNHWYGIVDFYFVHKKLFISNFKYFVTWYMELIKRSMDTINSKSYVELKKKFISFIYFYKKSNSSKLVFFYALLNTMILNELKNKKILYFI